MTIIGTVAPLLDARGLSKQYARGAAAASRSTSTSTAPARCCASSANRARKIHAAQRARAAHAVEQGQRSRNGTRDAGTLDPIRSLRSHQRRSIVAHRVGLRSSEGTRRAASWRVSAGANIGEPLMAIGACHYGRLRETAADWMARVELDAARIDELPSAFSGGSSSACRSRAIFVTGSRLVFMDEHPPAGLVTYPCRRACSTALRTLTSKLHPRRALIVTHDTASRGCSRIA